MASAESGIDYNIINAETGTLPSSGEELKQIRLSITLAGIDKLIGYTDDPTDANNLAPQPRLALTGTTSIEPTPAPTAVTIGEQPADWALHYRDRYYTRTARTVAGYTFGEYNGIKSATYSAATQYYSSPDTMQRMFYAPGGGFFGVSRYARIRAQGSATYVSDNVAALYSITPFASSDSNANFWWRDQGAAGTVLFAKTFTFADRVRFSGAIEDSLDLAAVDDWRGRALLQLVDFVYDGTQYIGIIFIRTSIDGLPQSAEITALSMPFWRGETPAINYGSSSGVNFGAGTFSDPSQPVGIPPIPTALTATEFGPGMHIRGLSVYGSEQNPGGVTQLFAELWSTTGFWSQWRNIRYDPLSAIVSLHMLPTQIQPSATTTQLSIAMTKITVQNEIMPSRIIDRSCGTVQIPEYYGSRLDYSDTQATIFLPFVGDYPLDISDVMGGDLSLTYRIDIATGDCIAFLLGTDRRGLTTISRAYKGNCAYKIPVSGSDNGGAGMMAALSSMVGGTVAIAAGNAIGGAADILGGAVEAATAKVNTTAPAIQGSASSMGVLTPYIKIYRAAQARPETYAQITGDTAAVGGTIATTSDGYPISGFAVYADAKLDIQATDQEIAEIRQLIKGGIYL